MQHFPILLLALGLGARLLAADPPAPGVILFQNVCAQCHGTKGEGNPLIKSPSIAGLPDWYLSAQVENFRADRRGAHPQDPEGQLMRAVSKVLNPEQTREVVQYVSKLPRQVHEATIKVDLTAGRELFAERCMECHRYNGEGELAFGAAPLIGLQDWYLASQLKKFKSGMRGAMKEDANGQKMVFSSSFIEDEAMLKSVVAYLRTLSDEALKPAFGFGQ
jgi:cbb3-type cytochrome c oxidase subunit III